MNSQHRLGRLRQIVHATVLLVACTPATALGSDFPAPATISPEAQQAVAQFSRAARNVALPAADDVEAWKKVQAEYEKKRAAANAAVVKEYQPEIKPRRSEERR